MSFKEQLEFALAVSGVAGASSELKRFESEAGKAADGAGSRWEGMGSKMQHVGAGLTLGVTVPLIAGFGMATKAALEDADAQEKLAGALGRNTGATKDQVAANEDWIGSQLKAKGFTDDELRPAIERATRSTKDLKQGQDLVSVAMDVAAQSGKPLQAVVEALSKAHDGNTTALKKLGIQVKDTSGEALSYDQVLQQLTTLTGGAAAEAANTQAGKLKIAKAELGETAETIGANLLPLVGKLAGGISKVTEAFDGLSPGMQKVVVYGGLAAAALGPLTTVAGTVAKNFNAISAAATSGSGMVPALGAAAVGVGVLVAAWEHHQRTAGQQKQLVADIGQALRDEAAGSHDAADAVLRHAFEQRGLGDTYSKLLTQVPDLNEQLLAGNDAWKDQATAAGVGGAQLIIFATEAGKVGDATKTATEESKKHAAQLEAEATAAYNAHAGQAGLAQAYEHATQKAVEATDTTSGLYHITDLLHRVTADIQPWKEAAEAIKNYESMLDATVDSSLDAEQGALNLQQKMEDLRTKLDEVKKSGDGTAKTQRDIQSATLDLIGATEQQVERLVASGQIVDDANTRKSTELFFLGQLKAQYPELGETIGRYIEKVNAVPTQPTTRPTVDSTQAIEDLGAVQDAINNLGADPIKLYIDREHWAAQVGLLEADLGGYGASTVGARR